jgi:predicted anti-sigma-YlaC factor YlaD
VSGIDLGPACSSARRTIHRVLDGEAVSAAERRMHGDHLARCEACREACADLDRIARALRALPAESMPAAVLEAVWERTVRAHRRSRWAGAARIAASLALVAALAGLWSRDRQRGPTDAELAHARAQARLVFGLAGRAIDRTEQAAIGAVLGRKVSGALDRLPVDWPEHERALPRRSET